MADHVMEDFLIREKAGVIEMHILDYDEEKHNKALIEYGQEQERANTERERKRADAAEARADNAEARADNAEAEAKNANSRADQYREKLIAAGIDPDE